MASVFPINLQIGQLIISTHLIAELLAFFFGIQLYLALRHRKKDKISFENRIWILVGAAFGALLFSRVLAILEYPDSLTTNFGILFYTQTKTIVGALIGGWLGVEITKKIIKVKYSSGDLFTYPLILGIIIGRIGCFLTGVTDKTVGNPSTLPWAMEQGDGILRHPTSLYEIIFLIFLWIILILVEKTKKLKDGMIFKFFMTSYLSFRFLIEFIKPINELFLGLSAIQIACLLSLLYFIPSTIKGVLNGKK